ncbi:uncharacterized protein LOC110463040 [Mizuhopecten yessoensis]|uniref:Major facilitator superfamily (MFS) profile domain-containing protein n=1 Tax=Mizuhopecten yessoensis TaxID=6573 RepID=A0A210PX12_MIZYE|nr:uncharacterized protein LOC110463040 [Mizuhopecten yessoensis]XP_021373051.1 uncharacterized protein LOC110463040 [Mizuhopecten yessoensis]XP_021373052.1 uncharacterized protein LOC110463040 [Mizuhopecten yessoensis]XP_021373053.1 uncharacterized protein LOC110463040 [Mizuhopecten yessoensis]OWF41023.1 hypothetical protein KP79_PYT02236 [Mizuhopecten yessoensis]
MEMNNLEGQKGKKLYTEEQFSSEEAEIIVAEETEVLSKTHVLLLNLSWFGLSLMFLLLSVEVVPAQIRSLVGEAAKGRWLGGMVACGAAVTFVTSPLIGMLSDRSTLQAGKRRPVMIAGTVVLCLGLIGMALSSSKIPVLRGGINLSKNSTNMCDRDLVAHRCFPFWNNTNTRLFKHHHTVLRGSQPASILLPEKKSYISELESEPVGSLPMYIVFYLVVTTAFAIITVPYIALIADKSHPSQRGFNSGVMGAMILLGNLSGAAVGTCFTQIGVLGAYGTAIAVVMVSVCLTIFTTRERQGKGVSEPLDCTTIFTAFWQPLKEHDFRWVFITRFLMQQGVSTVTGFLEYWLSDMIHIPYCWSESRAVAMMLLPLLCAASLSSIVFGVISDRFGRRKPMIISAALIMSVSTSTLTYISGYNAYFIALVMAFLFGIGFGSFQSVDFALVMDVLQDDKDKANNIAVWHQALVLPNALATPVGGIILDYFESVDCELGLGYIILFAVTAVYFLLSAIFVNKIRRAS